jgi:hypothetical protein
VRRFGVLSFSVLLVVVVLTVGTGSAFASSPITDRATIGKGKSTSTNWSGYAAYGTTFSDVKGSWTVPTADCSSMRKNQVSIATAFAGLDGYSSRTVEQTGTDMDCLGTNNPYYVAWYEFYPARAFFLDRGSYPVNPGDVMTSHVFVGAGSVTVHLHNDTETPKWDYEASAPSANLDLSSAEWILEAPSKTLTDFDHIDFSNASASGNGVTDGPINDGAWSNDAITMVTHRGTPRATPSPSSGAVNSFTVTYNNP